MDAVWTLLIIVWASSLIVWLWIEWRAAIRGWREASQQRDWLIEMLVEIAHEIEREEQIDEDLKLRIVR